MKNLSIIFAESGKQALMVLSDLHGDLSKLIAAIGYARKNNLFIVMIGDLIDGGDQPFECLEIVKKLIDSGDCVLVIGNHDDKHYRHSIGNPVKLAGDQVETMLQVGSARKEAFYKLIQDLVTHPQAEHYFHYGRTFIAHGSVNASIWAKPEVLSNAQRARCLYGETNGSRDERGWPNRTYKWVDNVPEGHTAIVGHDREALGKGTEDPLIVKTDNNGYVFFIDTSCGKDENGPLTGDIFFIIGDEPSFVKFKQF